jgi:hypothetical protein
MYVFFIQAFNLKMTDLGELLNNTLNEPKYHPLELSRIENETKMLINWIGGTFRDNKAKNDFSQQLFDVSNYHVEAVNKTIQTINKRTDLKAIQVLIPTKQTLHHPCGGRDDCETIVNKLSISVTIIKQ